MSRLHLRIILLVGFIICTLTSVAITERSTYASRLFSSDDNVKAFWPLEDKATHDLYLKNAAHFYRSAGELSYAPSRGYVVGYSEGNIQFRQSHESALIGTAIAVAYPGYLKFPLGPVRQGSVSQPTLTGSSSSTISFTLHGWMHFANSGLVNTVDDSSLLEASPPTRNSLRISAGRLYFAGTTDTRPVSTAAEPTQKWRHFALVVSESASSVSIAYYWDAVRELQASVVAGAGASGGGRSGSAVAAPSLWEGSWIMIRAPRWSPVILDEIALAASPLSPMRIAQIHTDGLRGPCLDEPCHSGVLCYAESSDSYACGPCPQDYHGDGITCYPDESFPVDYRCFPTTPSQLEDEHYCADHCVNRFACFSCTMHLHNTDHSLQRRSRSHCESAHHANTITGSSLTSSSSSSKLSSLRDSKNRRRSSSSSSSSSSPGSVPESEPGEAVAAVSVTTTPSPSPSSSRAPETIGFRDLLVFPEDFEWMGGLNLRYTMLPSFSVGGDAGFDDGGRGLESTVVLAGDAHIIVSFFRNDRCSNPGLSLFPSLMNWSWYPNAGRIQFSYNCNNPILLGEYSQATGASYFETGVWITLHVWHQPSLGKTTAYSYPGFDVNVNRVIPISVDVISESFYGGYHFGLAADQDADGKYTPFRNLRWY